MNTSKPFLKWAGGKAKLVPFIESNISSKYRKRLIEPFAGSMALSLSLAFEHYVINDSNPDLIGLFKTLQTQGQAFIDYAHSFFVPANNQEMQYYQLRSLFNSSQDVVERSALFIYLNRHAFNGLCRYNKSGEFNVPFGRYTNPYFPAFEMSEFIKKSDRFNFYCADFESVFSQMDEQDVVYCDPPYVPLSPSASFEQTMWLT